MKKLLLTLSLAAALLTVNGQIIVTGFLADPASTDALASNLGATPPVQGYAKEYIQLKATQNIDFSVTNYSIVTCNNAGSPGAPTNGWAQGGSRTYQFNLTEGSVAKGEIFYIGGTMKTVNGDANGQSMAGLKWIVSRNYAETAGDNGNGSPTANLLANSGNPAGIAIFSTTLVTGNTTPIDVVFFGGANGDMYSAADPAATPPKPEYGFRIANNDYYSTNESAFFRGGGTSNTSRAAAHPSSATTAFFNIGNQASYDLETGVWIKGRTGSETGASAQLITLNNASTVTTIEAAATTLPVSLTTFTAKPNKSGAVNLAWTTASEKDNSHFEVTRSTNGVDFNKLDEVKGNGNSDVVRSYSYTDTKPVVGTNYYRLKQVDNDGKYAFSGVATAKVGLSSDNLTAAVSANRTSVTVTYNALASGKALFNVYNISGAKIATVERNVNAGLNQISIPANLGNSLHILSVSQAGATTSTKF